MHITLPAILTTQKNMGWYSGNCELHQNFTINYWREDDQELATNFNEFFVNVGPSTDNTIPKVPNIHLQYF